MLEGNAWPFFIVIIISLVNNMEEEKLALGHFQEICLSFDLLTSSFLRMRINKYNCPSEMGIGGGRKTRHSKAKPDNF